MEDSWRLFLLRDSQTILTMDIKIGIELIRISEWIKQRRALMGCTYSFSVGDSAALCKFHKSIS